MQGAPPCSDLCQFLLDIVGLLGLLGHVVELRALDDDRLIEVFRYLFSIPHFGFNHWGTVRDESVAMSVNGMTTVAVPRDVHEKIADLHELTARSAGSEPYWYTVERALAALEAETDE